MNAVKPIASLAVIGVLLIAPALAASATSSVSSATAVSASAPKTVAPAQSPTGNAVAPSAPAGSAPAPKTATPAPAILRSSQLWATIDVCNPSDQPDTVGVRGSMPGDAHSKDAMFMRFRLQYLNSATKHWVDLANGADSGFVAVGAAKSARQAGFTFQLTPVAGKPAFMLRGVVSFEWRRGSTVAYAVSRPTTASHKSLSGADPAGFSAAACLIP
jgi:hypothetical protein